MTPTHITVHGQSRTLEIGFATGDGHNSGIYTWAYLYEMGQQQEAWWADYEARLLASGGSRDADPSALPASGCGSGGCGNGFSSQSNYQRGSTEISDHS